MSTIEEKYLELIQADVDGELPEQQRAELSRFLLARPEAQAAREELKRLCGLLNAVPAVEPPSTLKASILGAARMPDSKAGGGGLLRGPGTPPTMLRYAAALAGGALVSALAFQFGLDRRSGLDISEVAGTMVAQDPVAGSGPVDTIDVSLDQVSGRVSLYRSASMRVVEFELAARQPIDVIVVHDGQEARFSGFGTSKAGGTQRYALVLDGPGQPGVPIDFRFMSSGAVFHQETLGKQASN